MIFRFILMRMKNSIRMPPRPVPGAAPSAPLLEAPAGRDLRLRLGVDFGQPGRAPSASPPPSRIRHYRPAWTAPRRPEIDQSRNVIGARRFVQRGDIHDNGLSRHQYRPADTAFRPHRQTIDRDTIGPGAGQTDEFAG